MELYGFPDPAFYPCAGSGKGVGPCGYANPATGPKLRRNNDKLQPIWDVVDVLQPSIYMEQLHKADSPEVNAQMVNGTVAEAVRISRATAHKPAVFPYMYSYFNSDNQTTTLSKQDVKVCVEIPHAVGAAGLVIWGDPGYQSMLHHQPDRVQHLRGGWFATMNMPMCSTDIR